MNFTFADAGRSFLNIIQQDLPKEIGLNTIAVGSKNTSFAEKLSQTLKKIEENGGLLQANLSRETNNFRSASFQTTKSSVSSPSLSIENPGNAIEQLLEKLNQKEGISFISALKNIFLMLSKGELKNISIDADGLESLKKLLLKAGFKESDIDDLIAEFSEEFDSRDLTLDILFEKLAKLPHEAKPDIEEASENFFETSALPFLESILTSLGLPREDIQEILVEADKGDKGISLDVFIDKLQSLQKKSFHTSHEYKTKDGDDNFKLIAKQLGLELAGSKSSRLTLDELVYSFGVYRTRKSIAPVAIQAPGIKTTAPVATQAPGIKTTAQVGAQAIGIKPTEKLAAEVQSNNAQAPVKDEKSMDLLTGLFKGLELVNKVEVPKVFTFSYDQIKNQFENKVPMPDRGKNLKTDLASPDLKPPANTKVGDAFKELESLQSPKKEGVLDAKDPIKEGRESSRQLKSASKTIFDQSQVSTSDFKTSQTQTGSGSLKAGASFKNLPTFVTHQVGRGLARAISQGDNTITIQLKPAELGRIVMTIDNSQNSMKVSIVTENYAAKEILTSNANELRTVLSTSGVNLERFEVDMSSQFRQSMADAKSQSGNFGKRNRNREKDTFDAVNNKGMNDPAGLLNADTLAGSLHFVA